MELAKTEKAQDQCGGNLEDTLLDSETDKAVGLANLIKAVERIKFSLNPCRFFDFACRRSKKELDREQAPAK